MNQLTTGYLGPAGTFSNQAAMEVSNKSIPCSSFPEIISNVEEGKLDRGVLPIENSIEGAVTEVMDLLLELESSNLSGEIIIPINYHLMSNNLNSINEVKYIYSHPQALGQCRELFQQFPHLKALSASSTAEAAQKAKKDESVAALGPPLCADIYQLNTLWSGPKQQFNNHTRFVILDRTEPEPTGNDRTSICFGTSDLPGGLYSALKPFYEQNINLSRIESRPSKKQLGEYIFFLDIQGHRKDDKLSKALKELDDVTTYKKVFGSYPKMDISNSNKIKTSKGAD